MNDVFDYVPGDERRRLVDVAPDEMRVLLAYATADLAMLRLDTDEIIGIWEESEMPLPPFVQQRYLDGRRDVLAALVRMRFGVDDRTVMVAQRLTTLPPDEAVARILHTPGMDTILSP